MRLSSLAFPLLLAPALASCGDTAQFTVEQGSGPDPQLPDQRHDLIPTLNVAKAVGWPAGAAPTAAPGLAVHAFARDLDHPRWIYVLPNGDVLVAETNAPPKPDDQKGIKGAVMKHEMKKAGAGPSSANHITLLRDADGDGVPEARTIFLQGLNSPFGMALVGNDFYVADTDALLRYPYKTGEIRIDAKPIKLANLPAGPINHHWTKNVIASRDGSKLYVTIGSNSNAGENGIDKEVDRARILEIDRATGSKRVFATGLRNPNGLAWQPQSGALWTTVNERDTLGSDLVPDYMTSVRDGAFYGWPWSYFGQHVDKRPDPPRPDMVGKAIKPDYALGPHTASLGLTFYDANLLPTHYRNGAFIGQHGSWNRKPHSGYKVVFVAFDKGNPVGLPEDVLTGFLSADETARGRPVGVAVDQRGALLVADDVGNIIWRVTPSAAAIPGSR